MSVTFIDSFCDGWFYVRSESGKQGLTFEDSDRFGPSKVNTRTSGLSEIPAKHWFWRFYPAWVAAGRPTAGVRINTDCGPVMPAVWPTPTKGAASDV